jgi:hypothetical protein
MLELKRTRISPFLNLIQSLCSATLRVMDIPFKVYIADERNTVLKNRKRKIFFPAVLSVGSGTSTSSEHRICPWTPEYFNVCHFDHGIADRNTLEELRFLATVEQMRSVQSIFVFKSLPSTIGQSVALLFQSIVRSHGENALRCAKASALQREVLKYLVNCPERATDRVVEKVLKQCSEVRNENLICLYSSARIVKVTGWTRHVAFIE